MFFADGNLWRSDGAERRLSPNPGTAGTLSTIRISQRALSPRLARIIHDARGAPSIRSPKDGLLLGPNGLLFLQQSVISVRAE